MTTHPIRMGDIVRYAEGQYVVAERQGDLLVLDGVAVWSGSESATCRERCTVLDTDVELVGQQMQLGERAV